MAARAGFARPILHGLATWGLAGRALIESHGDNDPGRLTYLRARLSSPVYPGETLRVESWQEDGGSGELSFRARVVERDVLVLTHGRAQLR